MLTLRIASDLALPLDAVTQTFSILAKRGVGKTYLASVLTEEMIKAGQAVAVIDPIGVWWGLRAAANGVDPGLPIIVMGGDHGDVPLEEGAGELVADLFVDERLCAVLDLSHFRKGQQVRFMTAFGERLYHRNREPLHLMVDEADAFAPQRPQRGEERMLGAMEDLVRRGRARGIGLTLITQRSAVLNKDVLTQTECLVCLRTIAPQDRDAVDAWIKVHGTPEERAELLGSLALLPIGEAWFWSPAWLDLFKRVHIRQRETFDSSATPKPGAKIQQPKSLAEVDLALLRSRMAATIERAKADDPKALRAEIARLTKRLDDAEHQTPDPAAISNAVAAAVDGERAQHERRLRELASRSADLRSLAERLASDIGEAANALGNRRVLDKQASSLAAPTPRTFFLNESHELPRSENGQHSPPGKIRILTAIAQDPEGADREQISVLCDYRKSSRDTYIKQLRAEGLIEARGDAFIATRAGMALLGSNFQRLPSGDALRRYWQERLKGGEKRIFEILIKVYPDAILRNDVDAGYQKSSRDTFVKKLIARKLVETVGRGE